MTKHSVTKVHFYYFKIEFYYFHQNDFIFPTMIDLSHAENQIQCVTNFQDLVSIPFHGKINAMCWTRKLIGDFSEIVKKIEDLGIADNTIIIFTSDNGPHMEGGADPNYFNSNGNFKGYKRDLYEGGIRVPMIAYWPGKIKANTTSNHISAFWDVLPTVCDIAQIETPKNIDGISFLPELLDNKQDKHDYLYWEFHERGGKQAVRLGKWKGIRLKMANNQDAPIELYNLTDDIGEQNNVANSNPEIVAKISDIMKTEHATSDIFKFKYEK